MQREKTDTGECYWKTENASGHTVRPLLYVLNIYWVIYRTVLEDPRLEGCSDTSLVVELVSEHCILIFFIFSLDNHFPDDNVVSDRKMSLF